MQKHQIIASIRQNEAALRHLSLKSLALFGSTARNEHAADSDIDVLYEFKEGEATLEHYLSLQAFLENLFGRKVDLVPRKYVSPILKQYISDDLELVFTTDD